MDELFKAMSIFQSGLEKLAITNGISSASQQVEQLNQQGLNELEKRQARAQIANDLQMKMARIGAPASQIQAAVGGIMPQPIQNAQDAYYQALQTGSPELMKIANNGQAFENKAKTDQMAFQAGENAKDRNLQRELTGMRADKKMGDAEMQKIFQIGNQFEEKSSDMFKGYNLANTATQLLNSNNPVADKAVLNSLVKASGDTGVITEADREAFGGSPAYLDKMRRAMTQVSSGKLDAQSRQFLLQISSLYANKQKQNIEQQANRFAKRASNLLGVPVEEVKPKIFPGFDAMTGTTTQPAAQGAQQPSTATPAQPEAPTQSWLKYVSPLE